MTTRSGSAKYEGLGKDGKGHVSTQSGVLSDNPYGFNTRFENEPGTNPEELIAAAHASCFTMGGVAGTAPRHRNVVIPAKARIPILGRCGRPARLARSPPSRG